MLDPKSFLAGPQTDPEIAVTGPRDDFDVARISRLPERSQVSSVRAAPVPDLFDTAPSRSRRTLARGAMGAPVRRLQRTLVKLGHLTREAFATGPGVFGPRTEQAVRAFQLQAGLSPSGQVDALTELALQQSARR